MEGGVYGGWEGSVGVGGEWRWACGYGLEGLGRPTAKIFLLEIDEGVKCRAKIDITTLSFYSLSFLARFGYTER